MMDFSTANGHALDIVTSCVGCTSPASLAATGALISLLALLAWAGERRTIARKP